MKARHNNELRAVKAIMIDKLVRVAGMAKLHRALNISSVTRSCRKA
jgi:hypothetical protein